MVAGEERQRDRGERETGKKLQQNLLEIDSREAHLGSRVAGYAFGGWRRRRVEEE